MHIHLRYKKKLIGATAPTRKEKTDAGWDIYPAVRETIGPGGLVTIETGLIVWWELGVHSLPLGMQLYGQLVMKSRLAKCGLMLLGGVIDRRYCGPNDTVMVVVYNGGSQEIVVNPAAGQSICQIIPKIILDVHSAVEFEGDIQAADRGGFGQGTIVAS